MRRFLLVSLMILLGPYGQTQTSTTAPSNTDKATQPPKNQDSTAQVSQEAPGSTRKRHENQLPFSSSSNRRSLLDFRPGQL